MTRPQRAVAAAVVMVGAWATLGRAPSVPPASAANVDEILALRLQPCPAYHVASSRGRSASEVAAATAGTFEVRKDKPAHLVPPVDWSQDPYRDRSWVHYLHGFTWIDQLLYAYVHDGDLQALSQARDLLLDWIAANPPPAKPGTLESWRDKTTGDRSGYLGFVTRAAACQGLLSDAQASALLDSLRQHAANLLDPDVYQVHNHGLFADFGLALLGDYGKFLPEGPGWAAFARDRFRSTLADRLEESEGIWLEQSTSYQFRVIRLVERFAALFDPTNYEGTLASMRDAAGWLVTPAGDDVPYGDSNEVSAPAWAREEAADEEGLELMPRSGLAAVRDGGGYLLVTAAFHNRTHKHADDLGFHLFDRGRDVITDSGNRNYNIDKWRAFARSVAAHSVLSVGHLGFPLNDEDYAYGSGILAGGESDGWYAIKGRNPLLEPQGVQHSRLFLYRPGRALLVIDLVRARDRRTYHRRFQLAPGINSQAQRGKLALTGPGFRGALRDTGGSRLKILDGQSRPPRGWMFPKADTLVPRATLDFTTKARNAEFVAAFGLRGGLRADLLRARKGSLRVRVRGAALRRPATLKVTRAGRRLIVDRTPAAHRRR